MASSSLLVPGTTGPGEADFQGRGQLATEFQDLLAEPAALLVRPEVEDSVPEHAEHLVESSTEDSTRCRTSGSLVSTAAGLEGRGRARIIYCMQPLPPEGVLTDGVVSLRVPSVGDVDALAG